jgi:hypothetical protein
MNSSSTSISSNDYSFTLITQITNKNNNNNNKQIDLDSTLNDIDDFFCFDQEEWYPIINNNNTTM